VPDRPPPGVAPLGRGHALTGSTRPLFSRLQQRHAIDARVVLPHPREGRAALGVLHHPSQGPLRTRERRGRDRHCGRSSDLIELANVLDLGLGPRPRCASTIRQLTGSRGHQRRRRGHGASLIARGRSVECSQIDGGRPPRLAALADALSRGMSETLTRALPPIGKRLSHARRAPEPCRLQHRERVIVT